jgi:hypothetical protein
MENSFYVKIKNGVVSDLEKLNKKPFVAIVLVLTVGLLYHRFKKGKVAELYFSHDIEKKSVKLIYLKSTRDCSLKDMLSLLDVLYDYTKNNSVQKVETLVVNPFLKRGIMERDGWVFQSKKWIIGKNFTKYL